ncbi:hypothetical protein FraQA3DRAFT_1782 [Frankia sp. QA3]|nr:hypothetical protein FraQA3DRAFT_1782 [Frankia sp. QA3]
MSVRQLTAVEREIRDALPLGRTVDLSGRLDQTVRAEVLRDLLLGAADVGAGRAGRSDRRGRDGRHGDPDRGSPDPDNPDGGEEDDGDGGEEDDGDGDEDRGDRDGDGGNGDGGDVGGPGPATALRLTRAHITGTLDLTHAVLDFPVRLRGCVLDDRLLLYGARTRQLSFNGTRFRGLTLSTASVDGNLRLNRCESDGQIRLIGTRIHGALLLTGTRVRQRGVALDATRLHVENDIVAHHPAEVLQFPPDAASRPFHCDGEMRLNNAVVGGAVRLEGAHLHNRAGTALSAADLSVGTMLNCCDGFHAVGKVDIGYARVGSRVCLEGARLDATRARGAARTGDGDAGAPDCGEGFDDGDEDDGDEGGSDEDDGDEGGGRSRGVALDARHLTARELVLRPLITPGGTVDLRHAALGLLRDDPATWPDRLLLDGLRYDGLDAAGDDGPRWRWLRLDPGGYRPQVYGQLAATYRAQGRDADARTVLLAGHRHRRSSLGPAARVWSYLQDALVGYGYRPVRAAGWIALLVLTGGVVFSLRPPAPAEGVTPAQFHAGVYALDLLLPLIDFGQEKDFAARGWTIWFAYFLIAAGWTLATTVAAGVTRTLRGG